VNIIKICNVLPGPCWFNHHCRSKQLSKSKASITGYEEPSEYCSKASCFTQTVGRACGILSRSHLERLSAMSFTHTDGITYEHCCGVMIKVSKQITLVAVCVWDYIIDRWTILYRCIAELIQRDGFAHGFVPSVEGLCCVAS